VSFEVKRGEVLGVIGRNGAGKSTLLKILTKITEPTEGRAVVRGRVGSLLEVGTGFHPELTGRENTYLNGAILGMSKAEVTRKLDEIVDFAGDQIQTYIDTPVKRYSSGMYVRLAFAVAAHLESEILLVDEVLAVGDASFQEKCLTKIGKVATQGRTILFVSHNMIAIQGLCSRVLLLESGTSAKDGDPDCVVSAYLTAHLPTVAERRWQDPRSAPGNAHVRLHLARISPVNGQPSDPITPSTPLTVEFEYWNLRPHTRLNLSLHMYSELGVHVFATNTQSDPAWHGKPFPNGLFRSVCSIPANLLNAGSFRLELLFVRDRAELLHREETVLAFTVLPLDQDQDGWHGKWPGVVRPNLRWTTALLERPDAITDRSRCH